MYNKLFIKKINIILSIILLVGLFSSFENIKKVLAIDKFSQYTQVENGYIKAELKSNKDKLLPSNDDTVNIEYEITPQSIDNQINDNKLEYNNVKINFGINERYTIGSEATIDFGDFEKVPEELKSSSNFYGKLKVPINIDDGIAVINLDNCIKYSKASNSSIFCAESFKVSFDVTITDKFKDFTEFGVNNSEKVISDLIYDENINGIISKKLVELQTSKIIMRSFDSFLNVNLVSPSPNPTTAKIGDVLDVKYNINTDSSGTAIEDGVLIPKDSIDEVMFLSDISEKMKNCQRDSYLQNGIQNQIIGGSNINYNKMKMGIIAMGDKPILVRSSDDREKIYSNKNLLNLNNGEEKETFRLRVLKPYDIITNNNKDNIIIGKPNVEASLKMADEIFQKEGGCNSNKAIVIVTSNDFTCNEEVIKSIKNQGYKIIILDITNDNKQTQNLKNMYNNLGGYGDNYISGTFMDNQNYNKPDDDFKKLANSISNGFWNKPYTLSNIKLNFDLGEGFSAVDNSGLQKDENLEGNRYTITIPDIKFNCEILKNQSKEDPQKVKVRYVPDSTNKTIEFKVKFEKYNSDYSAIFGTPQTTVSNNNISYLDIGGYEVKEPIETPMISDDSVPKINVILESSKPMFEGENPKMINSSAENEINLSYNIIPQSFEYNKINSVSQDIVVIWDTTTENNGSGNEWNKAKERFNEYILDNFMNNNNVKLDVLSFDSNGNVNDITNGLTANGLEVRNKIKVLKASGDGYGQIDNSINKAIEILNLSNSSKKSIVIVTFGDIKSDQLSNDINNNKKYNIFTTYVSMIKNNSDSVETNIKNLHFKLSGNEAIQDENYINNSKVQGNGNNGIAFEKIMNRLQEKLQTKLIDTFSINDALLNFNLNNNFKLLNGAVQDFNNSNLIKIQIPQIIYRITNIDGKKKYVADPIQNINFIVQPISNKLGELRFANSTIEYKNINSNDVNIKSIETPVVNLSNPINIKHGIYKGFINNDPDIDDSMQKFSEGTTVTFASDISGINKEDMINLELDNRIYEQKLKIMYIYYIDKSKKIVGQKILKDYTLFNNIYEFNLLDMPEGGERALILYSEVLPNYNENNNIYTNCVSVKNKTDKFAKISEEVVSGMPDLF